MTAADVEAPLAFYTDARTRGESFDAGIRAGLARVLVSPYFLYRVERDPAGLRAGASRQVSDVELASRLSFFLWSSIPDQRLMDLASAGRSARARRAGGPGHADDRRPASRRAGEQLHRPVAAAAQPRVEGPAGHPDVPGLRRQHPRRRSARETEMLFAHILREQPERDGAPERRLHLRGRAAGAALRHSAASTAPGSAR